MFKILRSFAIAWALLVATVLIAQAGGWAVITVDDLPVSITAGQAFSIGFTVRQHGQTLRSDLKPIVHFDQAGATESFQVTAQRQGAEGHYSAQIKFPSAGQWNWGVDIEDFGMITQSMPPLTVQSERAGTGPSKTQLSPLSQILEFIAALRRVIAGQVPATTMPVSQTATKVVPVDQVALGKALFSAKGCVMCHAHAAIKTQAGPYAFGDIQPPNLSQNRYGADYLRMWLNDPAAVKPGTAMPKLGLKAAEIEALIAFLNNTQATSSTQSQASAEPEASAAQDCPLTTPLRAEPPRDPNADPFGLNYWYINADRTLWAGPIEENYPWRAGGNKVIWIRPQGMRLTISGRRLDAAAPLLKTWIPDGYTTGFQVTDMEFPTEGCWEITAASGESELRFVVKVAPVDVFLVRPEGIKGALVAYNMPEGQERFALPGGLLSADGKRYLAAMPSPYPGDAATIVTLFDPGTGKPYFKFPVIGQWALSAVSPAGRWAALTRLPSTSEKQAWTKANQWQTGIRIVESETGKTIHDLSLDGNFEVETISADGNSLFLVQHLPAIHPDHYLIRLYDLSAEQLQADPLRAKGADEVMAGLAWDGVASPDGRWLLTLYLSTRRDVAFVHTLDLQNKYPVCVDLPSGSGDLNQLKDYTLALSPDGQTIYATNASLGVVAEIDLNSRQVVRTIKFAPSLSTTTQGDSLPALISRSVISQNGRTVYFTNGAGIWAYAAPRGAVHGPYTSDGPILGLGLSGSGTQLYVAGADGTAQAIDVATIEKLKVDP